ncbi:uncharacterized protein LOC120210631 [Hibiscus syriacus]|uniref:uncharacterized protein LOC120210631 n=1 Tax=Hibiscus syriacus TaxID=106335 RepID=UPI001924B9FB|nr:uncharacterized protein LOC120210631 [Hibiscus syriacus]
MSPLRFNAFLLLSLLFFLPLSHGLVEGFQGGMQRKYHSLHQQMKGGNYERIQMSSSSRKLLTGAMLDYDDTGANTKHEPRRKPGKP